METKDWITIVAAILVIIGWFVNSSLNRRHEIAKKRMEYRLKSLSSFIPIFFALVDEDRKNKSGLQEELSESWTSFQLYGTKDEIECFERLRKAIEKRDEIEYSKALGDLIRLVREGIRDELGLEKYEYTPE